MSSIDAGARSLGEIVEATGLTRPTAHRLASAMETHGLLMREGPGRWRLGYLLLRLGASAAAEIPLEEAARPALEWLRDRTDESAQLWIRTGNERVCVEVAYSTQELRTTVPLGTALPMTAGASAKIFLAWMDETELAHFLEHVEPMTRTTPTDPSTIRKELKGVRAKGWAETVGERADGVASVAAPLLDAEGSIVAAISVSGPIARFGRAPGKRYAQDVMSAARRIESVLGGHPYQA